MGNRNSQATVLIVLLLAIGPVTVARAQSVFDLSCHPFQTLEARHPIDTSCPSAAGNAPATPQAHGLQNKAKNNFCAAGQPVDIQHADLLQLQSQAQQIPGYQSWDKENLPASRAPFTHMAGRFQEGTLVRYTGFIYELHAADVDSGESVNCSIKGPESNDIHIAFVADAAAKDECTSITAEMSPHFRPTAWVASDMAPKLSLFLEHGRGNWMPNPTGRRLARVTGQLMFDAAHKPCRNGVANPGDPARASDWEVHPVYAMEVCRTAGTTKCDDSDWQALDQFLASFAKKPSSAK